MMISTETRKALLENRLSLLSAKPVENAKLVAKTKRQLRLLDKND